MRTPLTDLLGIEHPIVQAPIGSAASPALAAAVSRAGALGHISATFSSLESIGGLVDDVRAATDAPFAANVLLQWPPEERLDAVLGAGVRVVSLAWGDPAPWVGRIHDGGALLMATVGSAEEAKRAEAAGVDVVVAQGWEAGGHVWGTVATTVLVPAVRDAVSIPVVAAGGIADGRGLAAALALGADGAWIGTRFLLAEEAPIHPIYRDALLAADETTAVYVEDLFHIGWEDAPHRALRNSTVARWEEAGRPPIGRRPGEGDDVAARADGTAVLRYQTSLPLEGMTGELEALSLYAGQSAGLLRGVEPAAAIVNDLVAGAEDVLRRLRADAGP